MKKLINNKKGFTLIELLAVIVILAILVMVSIPAVMRYLDTARKGTFSDAAATAVSAVRNDVIVNGRQGTIIYKLKEKQTIDGKEIPAINDLLEVKLESSPYTTSYKATSFIKAVVNNDQTQYYICLTDGTRGIKQESSTIDKDNVTTTVTECSSASDFS